MRRRALTPMILAVILATAIVLAWLLWPRPRSVEIIRLSEAPATRLLAINGKIRPQLAIDVQAPLGGTLRALPFDVGAQVQAGAILARIDDAPEAAAIDQARAAVGAQEATLAQAHRDLARYEALGQFAARREVEERRLVVTEGARELRRRRAALVEASEQRDRRIIRAPFSGIILERPVDPGQVVGADTVIYRLADLNLPEVSAEIDEVYAAEVKPGARALVRLPGTPRPLRARVLHVEPLVDPATGAREARLELLDAPAEAPDGLTATINVIVDQRRAALSVPRSAILQLGQETYVRVVSEDDIVGQRRVQIVDWPAERVIVESGLRGGERILGSPSAARVGERVTSAE